MLKPTIQKYEYSVLDYRSVDGDSVVTLIDLGYCVFHQATCRLDGIDTPENSTAAGKLVGKVNEVWLARRAHLGFIVNSISRDKYDNRYVGRLRTSVKYENDVSRCLNDFLIEQRLAKPYDGKKKSVWTVAELTTVEQLADQVLRSMGYYQQPPILPNYGK